MALNKNNPEKITFYIRHEKLSGKWGNKNKVDKIRRCYISKLSPAHIECIKKYSNTLLQSHSEKFSEY